MREMSAHQRVQGRRIGTIGRVTSVKMEKLFRFRGELGKGGGPHATALKPAIWRTESKGRQTLIVGARAPCWRGLGGEFQAKAGGVVDGAGAPDRSDVVDHRTRGPETCHCRYRDGSSSA